MYHKYLLFTFLLTILVVSCNKSQKSGKQNKEIAAIKKESITALLIGLWVQPNPINNKQVQGFTLKSDSTAESINMHTLIYKKWWEKDNKLTLISESIGNGISFLDTTSYEITKLDNKELVLKHGDLKLEYKRD